jgi:hypothetical protein
MDLEDVLRAAFKNVEQEIIESLMRKLNEFVENACALKRVYGGNIEHNRNTYRVRFQHKGHDRFYATFATREEAESFRIKTSNDCGLTKTQYLSYRDRHLEIPIDIRKVCCGFIDGDGCITMYGNTVTISVSQSCKSCEPKELLFIRRYYGGSKLFREEQEGHRRPRWKLHIARIAQVVPLLEDMIKYSVLKFGQAEVALKWIVEGKSDKSVAKKISHMNEKSYYQQLPIDQSRLNHPYIAGLFGAEGCCSTNTSRSVSITVTITQVNSLNLLYAIQDFFGFGSISQNEHWRCTGSNAVMVLQEIRPYCFGSKTAQIDLLVDWYLWDDREFARNEYDNVKRECSRLKRL